MFLSLVLLFCIALYKVKFDFSRKGFENYLAKDETTSVKGFCFCLVFISHISGSMANSFILDQYANKFVHLLGQAMVVPFLFYSGYGVMLSIMKKGKIYVQKMPKNRILKVLIKFEIVLAIKLIIDLMMGRQRNLEYVLVSMLSRYDWYILAILLLYLFTYLAYIIFAEKRKYSLFLFSMFIMIVCCVVAMYLLKFERFYYDTMICYLLGILWALYKQKVDKITLNNLIYYSTIIVLCAIILLIKIKFNDFIVAIIFSYCLICVCIILITKKVQMHNKLLNLIGKYLFDIYLLHWIPISLFDTLGLADLNSYLYFVICVILTGVLVYFSKIITEKITNMITKRNEKNV